MTMKTMIGNGEFKVRQTVIRIVLATALILLVPLVAMQFTDEVTWTRFDFAVAGALLIGTGLIYVMLARKVNTPRHRAVVGVSLAVALLLVWIELAVGIVGS
jgi:hypothetical protein